MSQLGLKGVKKLWIKTKNNMAFKAFNKWGLQSFQQVRASKLSTSEGFLFFTQKLQLKTKNKQTNKQTKEST
jgi:hypothetical protein